jgi:multiple sugar transport system ATP-binding protein
MNLVEMTVDPNGDRPFLRAGALMLPVPDGAVASLSDHVTVGIRPEDIRMDLPPDGETSFRAKCDLVENLGHQVLVHLRVGDMELLAFDDPARHLRAGDIVDGAIALDNLRLFDSRTGRSLPHP